jgi:hypothetical protein
VDHVVPLLETSKARAGSSKEADRAVVIGPLVEDPTTTVPASPETDLRLKIPSLLATPPTTASFATNKLEASSAGVYFTPLQDKTIAKPSASPTTKLGLPTSADAVVGTVPKSPISWNSTAKPKAIGTLKFLEPKFPVAETSLSPWSVAR